jgi:hypothetical protein
VLCQNAVLICCGCSCLLLLRCSGKPCEAQPNAVQTKPCNEQSCGQAVNDFVTAVSGQWTPIDVTAK